MLDERSCFDRPNYDEWFGLLPYHARKKLTDKAEMRSAKVGEVITKKGDKVTWLGVVLTGRIRICLHSLDGREMLISMVLRGEVFGERAVFDEMPRVGETMAEEDTTYLVYKREDLMPFFFDYPDMMVYLIKILSNRIVRYINTMELYAMQSLPVRLANFLVFYAQKYGKQKDAEIALPFCLSQTDLSHQIASSRESINRQMKVFADQGLISIRSGEIVVHNVEGLKKICLMQCE